MRRDEKVKVIGTNAGYSPLKKASSRKAEGEQNTNSKKVSEGVVFEKGQLIEENKAARNYSHLKSTKYTVNKDEIERMKAELDEKMKNSFLQMAKEIINDQNTGYKHALELFLKDKKHEIKPEMIEQAKKDIAEGGYWSVENTSDRILKFAKAISGGDPEKADMLKEAFLKGFEEAEKAWGGGLPEISQRTKEAVLKGFDDWSNEADV